MPLLAVAKELVKQNPETEFLFVGTIDGIEKNIVEQAGFKFVGIPAAKLRRYLSFRNLTDIFTFFKSLFVANKIVVDFKPDVVFSVGGFVAVPVSWMGKWHGAKIIIHQQDARIGLANRLVSPFADIITSVFEETAKKFYTGSGFGKMTKSAEWVGNPIRPEFFRPLQNADELKRKYHLVDDLPILLVFGGGTGSTQINRVVGEALPELVKTHQIIHMTGSREFRPFKHANYHQYDFVGQDFPELMKLADTVLVRAGVSTISELSALGKIAIVVPMPDSHQEDNGYVLKARSAAVVLDKDEFNSDDLPRIVTSLKFNVGRQKLLTANIQKIMPHDAAQRIVKLIIEYARN